MALQNLYDGEDPVISATDTAVTNEGNRNQSGVNQSNQIQTVETQNQTSSDQNQTEAVSSGPNQAAMEIEEAHRPTTQAQTEPLPGQHDPSADDNSLSNQRPPSADSGHLLQWRYGESHPKAKKLLLRYATVLDVKKKGAARESVYYRKHGRPGGVPSYTAGGPGGGEEETTPKEDLR